MMVKLIALQDDILYYKHFTSLLYPILKKHSNV